MSRTRKPCPGCKSVVSSRSADDICHGCKQLIKEALSRREQIAKAKDVEAVKLPFADYCLPTFYKFKGEFKGDNPRRAVQSAIFSLVKLVGKETSWRVALGINPEISPVSGDYGYVLRGESGCDSGDQTYWLLPRGLKKLLNELYGATVALGQEAFADGEREGHSLLLGLATGETSIDEFNKATIGKVANKRRAKGR